MASSAKDIQLRELMDTVSQLKTMMAEQTELIRSLRTVIDEKTAHEAVLQEQVDYLTKSFSAPPVKRHPLTSRDSSTCSTRQRQNRTLPFRKKTALRNPAPERKRRPMQNFSKVLRYINR